MPWLPSTAICMCIFWSVFFPQKCGGCACPSTAAGAEWEGPCLHAVLAARSLAPQTVRVEPSLCSVGALPSNAYWKIGVFFGGLLAFFLLFSLPFSYIKVGVEAEAGRVPVRSGKTARAHAACCRVAAAPSMCCM